MQASKFSNIIITLKAFNIFGVLKLRNSALLVHPICASSLSYIMEVIIQAMEETLSS